MDWKSTINAYKTYLMLERALSENTLNAYLHDVKLLHSFLLEIDAVKAPTNLSQSDLEQFLKWINEIGMKAYSQARILSGLRSFFKFLLIENLIDDDPTELLEGPKTSRKLPDVLSYNEIEKLLASIDLSHPQGQRNRAMLETLYACGLRVSELITLRLSNYFPDVGYIKVIGKK